MVHSTTRSRLLLASLVCLCASIGFAQPRRDPINVALGKQCVFSPAPNYEFCTDPLDPVQLTDGKSTRDYFWTDKGTVGWSGVPYATITIDLGRVEPIDGIALTTAAGAAGVTWPAAIPMLLADDGKAFRNVGDLVAMDRRAHGPLPEKYAIRRLVASSLQTRGRFVRLMLLPPAGGSYLFVDEIEVLRGKDALLSAQPTGVPVADVDDIYREARIGRGVQTRYADDVRQLEQRIRVAKPLEPAQRSALLDRLQSLRKKLDAAPTPSGKDFRAVLPFSVEHEQLFALRADLWRSAGAATFSAAAASAWDPVALDGWPPPTGGRIEIHAMLGEYRAAAIQLYNAGERPIRVRIYATCLPGGPTPSCLTLQRVQWTDTVRSVPVAAALVDVPPADGAWTLEVLPGLVRQVWLTLHPLGTPAGVYDGQLHVQPEGQSERVIPARLRIWPMEFPRKTTLLVGGWSYTDGDGAYGVNPTNRPAFLRHLQQHGVNCPWATGSVLLACNVSNDPKPAVTLDTRRIDQWLRQWPDATRYMVFLGVGPTFADRQAGTPEFNAAVHAWISAWVRHLSGKAVAADRLGLLIHDEPNEGTDARPIVAWARAIRAAEPRVRIWLDPTYQDPTKAPAELLDTCDILCPNRPMWLTGGKSFADFYRRQQQRGRTLQFYSCSGPVKTLDPYSYYRLQAWHCWCVKATGSFFWALGDNGGASSWNEYLAAAGPFTPLFVDASGITAGKHMEAIRESVEDYEYFVLLNNALDAARRRGRNDAAIDRAASLLQTAAQEVVAAPGADALDWHATKDRSRADVVRIAILEAMQALRQ